jgi:CubicO group peptidase (beta-lactamase class C family)
MKRLGSRSKFAPVWRSVEDQVAAGWAPGIVAGVRHQGETEYFATGSLAFGSVTEPWTAVGRYGWNGGAGTSAYTDPSRDLIGVVLSQRFMTGSTENFGYFWGPLATVV